MSGSAPCPLRGARMTLKAAMITRIGKRDSVVRRAAARLVSRAVMPLFFMALRQDADVWNHRRFVAPPHLARGDGRIGPFRRWADQFYRRAPEAAPMKNQP
ncbi:hypothetical protein [Streptomyces sp. NPDC051662]|uniref:hypothetical protein n=1 Tax=Streptomyces sp. NPDC051662 TaxID=3154750 RepID=UPI00342DC0FB